jgi:exopolysaccharide biosynthesis polyprenyl glycosylphosphotransferase
MRRKDALDAWTVVLAVAGDAFAVFGGFLSATWLRFDSGWFPVDRGRPTDLYPLYVVGAAAATLVFLAVHRALGLYARPQTGSFPAKLPRLARTTALGILLTTVLAFAVKNDWDYSRFVIALAAPCVLALVVLQRYLLFRLEWNVARHSPAKREVLIVGTDAVAARLMRSLGAEPMLRLRVAGLLRAGAGAPDPSIPAERILGSLDDLPAVAAGRPVRQLVLTDPRLPQEQVLELLVFCEQNLITFTMVPDLFHLLTGAMDVQSIEDIPLLGVREMPLDRMPNRILKRTEDIAGALFGLLVSAPVLAAAAALIKLTSPGPVFYSQERCGRDRRVFRLHKLRTMRVDAETGSGPVFAVRDDPRVTRVGAFLRRHSLDELPQLWDVLRGEMSLVGPRPERPHFVEQFRTGIDRYMRRHLSKPGLTGWAQVNGLRGNTSIEERVKYDLYYLERWSLAFDFKILVRTLFARENAY